MRYSWLSCLLLVWGCVYVGAKYWGLYLNISDSMPKGFYRQVQAASVRGSLAVSCLTPSIATYGLERGYLVPGACPTGIQPVMKKIIAIPGDNIQIRHGYLIINHIPHPELKIAMLDSKQRPLQLFYPSRSYVIGEGQYMLVSDYVVNSWDSRYWGPVGIEKLVVAVWEF